ncbi:Ti-type conjugative transfer relaxase TraA [Aureimonas pseudogalii]|uniref:Ti-type conjugative transfer relaxase TraA n=1 Tax=Aureimonas pseudogalii TaxID=1744844 RepID=A0A7W6MM50_9HYPH|nr:Ti-type conjugative transfer relaxase TraA [Aureimonas pseudogalii]MBB4000497.1 Ti-type conjugative transfer relaxase TraA [Aureimonas pseudogalii]
MAIYHCSMKSISRTGGRSAVAAAAYRSGTLLVNERDGLVHDYRMKGGIVHAEIVLPKSVEAAWALDRSRLWNAAEQAEKRCDARVAREFEVAIPHELTADQRVALVRSFSAGLADRYGVAVDFALHEPQGNSDLRNAHAHILMTTREIGPDGFGLKSMIERENRALLQEGHPTSTMQLREVRLAWEQEANTHLARAGHEERIDHRSHRDRGLEIEPSRHMGVHATQMERQGKTIDRVQLEREAAERNAALIRERPEHVLEVITGEKSVFDRHDVARALHRAIDDPALFGNAFASVMASLELVELKGEVRDGRGNVSELARFSTREMVAIERSMVEGAAQLTVSGGYGVGRAAVERAMAARPMLADEQREAIRHVTGEGRLAAVIGRAGTGKSTMLNSAREAWEDAGYRVHGAALAGKAAEELQGASGIPSRTLASCEHGWGRDRDRLGRGDILVIDEAGMVSSKQMARFVAEAERSGAKLVLVGDPQQLQPIGAGAAFRSIAERTGFADLEEIRRQREPWQREASQDFARHRIGAGLQAYDDRGAVRFEGTREAARTQLVRDVLQDRTERPEGSRLVLTYRNSDVRQLNEAIRGEIQSRGSLTDELRYPTNEGERRFAVGDRLLFLENDRELGVKNGMLGTVTAVEPGLIRTRLDGVGRDVETPRTVTIPTDRYQSFDHGYATTVHKSQGATVDRAFVLATPGMDSHLAYVAMTRHRDEARLYAGRDDFRDMKSLRDQLSIARGKETTMDYLKTPAERQAAVVAVFAERRGMDGGRADAILVERGREETGREAQSQPHQSLQERMAGFYAGSGRQEPSTQRSGLQRAERGEDGVPVTKVSVAERIAALEARAARRANPEREQERERERHQRHELPISPMPSARDERTEDAGPVRKVSVAERIAALEARAASRPKTEQELDRERQIERDRERGGYER